VSYSFQRFRGAIWSYKWQLFGSVLKRGVHVLAMDVDTIVVRPFTQLIESSPGSHLIVGRGSKQADEVLGTSFIYLKSSPQILSFLPKFVTLTNKVLDDHRALNLILNTGFVRWSSPPLQDGQVIDGVAKSGVKVTILPNLQVRAHCDSGEYPAQTAIVVHCKIPRAQRPEVRAQMLTKYGVWLLRENFQFVEFPGNFESWLDVIIDTRSLAYTVMTTGNKKGNSLFSVGMAKAPPPMIGLNQAPVIPINKAPRMGRGIGLGQP